MRQIPADAGHEKDAEQGEEKFAHRAAELQPEGHSVVLRKMNDEPVAANVYLLPQKEVRLDPDFDYLVKKKNEGDDGERSFQVDNGQWTVDN
jgi:hypothetical protein